LKRLSLALAAVLVCLAGACHYLLPERFAVNAPVAHMLFGVGSEGPVESQFGGRIQPAAGFSIDIYATEIPNARWLRPLSSGGLLVSQPRSGRVLLLEPDRDGDGQPDGRRALLEGLELPHGMDLHDDWLYVAEADGIGRVLFDEASGQLLGAYTRIVNDLPSGGNHSSRTIRFGPDGWMYVSVGSSCNVCEDDPRRAALLRFHPDGSGEEVFATGLRNAVGFDWRPETGELYATDNGRDLLGDDFPPCELNHVVRGGFYGWPYANGDRVPDPDFGAANLDRVAESIPPAHGFGAHNAPLGITFVRSAAAPAAYRGAALVALHGSWNRTEKVGYKIVSLHWSADGQIEERDFVAGFELAGDVVGRPVDVVEGADGAFYVSDDYAGAIYRVAPGGASTTAPPASLPRSASSSSSRARLPADGEDARSQRGSLLYERFECAGCHEAAAAGAGVTFAPLRDLASRYSVESLAEWLAAPTPPMPAFPMNAQERRDLAVFLLDRS
jgi:glucose/arabinose dehydrogenase/cytochrome c553